MARKKTNNDVPTNAVKLRDFVPSPLREKLRMRGNFKGFFLFDSPLPSPLPQGEGVYRLNLTALTYLLLMSFFSNN
jgi:hypothetical protein